MVRFLHYQGCQIDCLLRASSDTSRFNGDVQDADSTKAVRELGYKPKSAVEVLTPLVNWLAETDRINA